MNFYKKLKLAEGNKMIKTASLKQSQSLLDILMRSPFIMNQGFVDKKDSSFCLYQVWSKQQNNGKSNFIKKSSFSLNDIEILLKQGLIKSAGNNVQITQKGIQVLKVMILGTDASAFDIQPQYLTYKQALDHTKNIKRARSKNKIK